MTPTARLLAAMRLARLALDAAMIVVMIVDRFVAPPDSKPRAH